MVAVSTITPQQTLQYRQQRNDAGQQLLTSQAQNLYQRQLADLAQKNRVRAFDTEQGRIREGLPTDYINRGIFRSGIYNAGLKRYAADRLAGYSNLALQHQLDLGNFGLQNRGYEDDYTRALARSYGQEHASRADVASALRGIL